MIRDHFPDNTGNILDAAYVIGTQLIGLAGLGYSMTGTDISNMELAVTRDELKKEISGQIFMPEGLKFSHPPSMNRILTW